MPSPNLLQNKVEKTREYYQLLKEDYVKVFSTSEGKRVLEDIGKSGYLNKSTFQPGDPYSTARNEGIRTMALNIIDMAKRDEDKIKEKGKAVV